MGQRELHNQNSEINFNYLESYQTAYRTSLRPVHACGQNSNTHTHTPTYTLRHQIQNITDELKQLQSSMPKVLSVKKKLNIAMEQATPQVTALFGEWRSTPVFIGK
jgi:hypothetical protein